VSELLVQCYNLRSEGIFDGLTQKNFIDEESALMELIKKEYHLK